MVTTAKELYEMPTIPLHCWQNTSLRGYATEHGISYGISPGWGCHYPKPRFLPVLRGKTSGIAHGGTDLQTL